MTKKQITYALRIVDDIHRIKANTTPGSWTWIRSDVPRVARALEYLKARVKRGTWLLQQ